MGDAEGIRTMDVFGCFSYYVSQSLTFKYHDVTTSVFSIVGHSQIVIHVFLFVAHIWTWFQSEQIAHVNASTFGSEMYDSLLILESGHHALPRLLFQFLAPGNCISFNCIISHALMPIT